MFTSFIFKLTGFCNLDCSYCYMFNSEDRTFERKPRYMSPEVATAALRSVGDYLAAQPEGAAAAVVLHGGEPSIWPAASFAAFCEELARQRARGLEIECGMQTNGLKLPSRSTLDLFVRHEIGLGFSLDGPKALNDRFRYDFAGRGSYDRIIRNVNRLLAQGYERIVGGFLCVMQPDIPPDDFLDWLAGLPVTRVDLLWPLEFNRDHPPWQGSDPAAYAAAPRYGAWLSDLFEAWWRRDDPDLYVRLFRYAVEARLGGMAETDSLGPRAFDSLVINTDGAVELTDYFRTAVDGGTWTGRSVLTDSLGDIEADERIRTLASAAQAPGACEACDHRGICAGGTLSGRLNGRGEVTREPSVLCADHMRFFDTLAARVDAALAA